MKGAAFLGDWDLPGDPIDRIQRHRRALNQGGSRRQWLFHWQASQHRAGTSLTCDTLTLDG